MWSVTENRFGNPPLTVLSSHENKCRVLFELYKQWFVTDKNNVHLLKSLSDEIQNAGFADPLDWLPPVKLIDAGDKVVDQVN